MESLVSCAVTDRLCRLTLNRPDKLNALTFARNTGVQIALRIDGHAADADELSGQASTGPEG